MREKNSLSSKFNITAKPMTFKGLKNHYIDIYLIGYRKKPIKSMIDLNIDEVIILGKSFHENGIDIEAIENKDYKCDLKEKRILTIYDLKLKGRTASCYFDIRKKVDNNKIILKNVKKLEFFYVTDYNEKLKYSIINFSNNSKFLNYLIKFFSLDSISFNFKYYYKNDIINWDLIFEDNISNHYLLFELPVETKKTYWSFNNLNLKLNLEKEKYFDSKVIMCISSFSNGFLALPTKYKNKLCEHIRTHIMSNNPKQLSKYLKLEFKNKEDINIIENNISNLGNFYEIKNKNKNNTYKFNCLIEDINSWNYSECYNKSLLQDSKTLTIGIGKNFLSNYNLNFVYKYNSTINNIMIYKKKVEYAYTYLIYIMLILFILILVIVIFSQLKTRKSKKIINKDLNEIYEKII